MLSPLLVGGFFNCETLLKLTAGGVDVIAARIADGRLDAVHGETALKGLDLLHGRRLEGAVGDIV